MRNVLLPSHDGNVAEQYELRKQDFPECERVLFQQRGELLLKSHFPMMFLLVLDVGDDRFELRNADAECAILYLPRK